MRASDRLCRRHGLQNAHQGTIGQEHQKSDEDLDGKITESPGNPARRFCANTPRMGAEPTANSSLAPRNRRLAQRTGRRTAAYRAPNPTWNRQRGLPPALTAQLVEHGNIQQLPDQIGRAGGHRDARHGSVEGKGNTDHETGKHHAACNLRAELAVRQVCDQKAAG